MIDLELLYLACTGEVHSTPGVLIRYFGLFLGTITE
jgi:hypothetical protein